MSLAGGMENRPRDELLGKVERVLGKGTAVFA